MCIYNKSVKLHLTAFNVLQDMTTVCRDELRKLKKEDPRYSGELNSHAFFIANLHVPLTVIGFYSF